MRVPEAMLIARPAARADRGRILLIAVTAAVAGGLLIAAASVARISSDAESVSEGTAPYLYASDDGMRPGVLIGAAMLTIPLLAFALQALRVGSVARDRRMAALRLAGATPQDVRLVAAAESGGAALTGGLFSGWVYALLWLVLGLLPPWKLELLPNPGVLDLLVWAGVAILAGIAGACAGAAVQQRVITEPLGVYRRARPRGPGRLSVAAIAAGPALVVAGVLLLNSSDFASYVLCLGGVVVTALGAGPLLVHRLGRRLRERGGAAEMLAGWRLESEPRTMGRVAMVLFLCGFTLGFESTFARLWYGDDFGDAIASGETGVYLMAVAAAGAFGAVVLAVLTLVVGAAEQLLDGRRSLATLVAMGVELPVLQRTLHRQLAAASVPAVLWGVATAAAGMSILSVDFEDIGSLGPFALLTALGALVAWLAVTLAARLATRLLAPRLRAAVDPENLRVA